ncbi:MAG: hypothetical protein RIS76_3570 [Verrucomicrobiota bacterium]
MTGSETFDPVSSRGYGSSRRVDFVRVRGSEIIFSGDVGAGVWPDSEQMTVTSFDGELLRSGQPLKLSGNSFGLSGAVPYGADQWIAFGEFSTSVLPLGLARLGGDLGVDSTFQPSGLGSAPIAAVAVESDGRLLVASRDASVQRILADGSTVNAVSLPLDALRVAGLTSLLDGRFLAWGLFESKTPRRWHPLLRCLPDGQLDPSFRPGLDSFMPSNRLAYVTQLVVDREGRLLIALQAQPMNWQDHMQSHLIRLLPDGTLDRSFEPVVFNFENADNDCIHAIALQEDGAILVGGDFTHMNGLPRRPLVRLKGTGVAAGRTPVVRALSRTPEGILDLKVSAAPARDSVLERSSDLLHWESVSTNQFPLSQSLWRDSLPVTGDALLFYRIVQKND